MKNNTNTRKLLFIFNDNTRKSLVKVNDDDPIFYHEKSYGIIKILSDVARINPKAFDKKIDNVEEIIASCS